MITYPTVLVLGAGASADFGLPIGRGLVTEIGRFVEAENHRGAGPPRVHDRIALSNFARALMLSAQTSVDRFVEHRRDLLGTAKLATACALVRKENPDLLFGPNGGFVRASEHWYEHLLEALDTSAESFKDNKLSVVTFNYDRSLEYYLLTALMNRYGLDRGAAVKLARAIEVVHVYGDLGEFYNNEDPLFRDYARHDEQKWFDIAASRLHLVPEERSQGPEGTTPQAERAKELLRTAQRVYFLGFGFDTLNLTRIRPTRTDVQMRVFASAYDVREALRYEINQRLMEWLREAGQTTYSIKIGRSEDRILEFLRGSELLSRPV